MAPQTMAVTLRKAVPIQLPDHNTVVCGQCLTRHDESRNREVARVTITPHQVMPKIHEGNIKLKSCLKKEEDSGLPRKPRNLRFNLQTEVQYYLSRPLVSETGLRRVVSNVKGKISAVKITSPCQSKPRLPFFLSTRIGKADVYVMAN